VLGVTTVILGKHIDKAAMDRQKHIRTLPVLIGEAPARYLVVLFLLAPYVLIAFLVVTKYFTPALAVVLLAVPALVRELPAFFRPKPVEKPEGFPEGEGGWPLYFAPKAFVYTRSFGTWFLLGLVAEVALRIFAPGFWRS
jgi:1,4-dihydroxy-2-naphthoate octaprenyltransferase